MVAGVIADLQGVSKSGLDEALGAFRRRAEHHFDALFGKEILRAAVSLSEKPE